MALLLIPAAFLFVIALGLFVLAIVGVILMVVLRILTAILWIVIKILEHRKVEPEILIVVEEEHPMMRDVTPRKTMQTARIAQGD
jgi:hypothetical protein